MNTKWQTYTKADFDPLTIGVTQKANFYPVRSSPDAFICVVASYSPYYKRVEWDVAKYANKANWNDCLADEFEVDLTEAEAKEQVIEWGGAIS